MIVLKDISKTYQNFCAVRDLTLKIHKGETFVLLGRSGCGKTTTLKMINRLIKQDSGTIKINGVLNTDIEVVDLRRKIGYVFQNIGLLPHFTIHENLCIVPKLLKWDKEKIKKQLITISDILQIDKTLLKRHPRQLSGGQRQRIGVGRALMGDPDIVLMDEPFGALDPITREEIQEEFSSVKNIIQKTIMFVTHDIHEAFTIADRICLMEEGKIVQVGTKHEILKKPVNDFVARFTARHATALRKELEQV